MSRSITREFWTERNVKISSTEDNEGQRSGSEYENVAQASQTFRSGQRWRNGGTAKLWIGEFEDG